MEVALIWWCICAVKYSVMGEEPRKGNGGSVKYFKTAPARGVHLSVVFGFGKTSHYLHVVSRNVNELGDNSITKTFLNLKRVKAAPAYHFILLPLTRRFKKPI